MENSYSRMQDDTVTMLLCNAVNRAHPISIRAQRIRRLAKLIESRSVDKDFKLACKRIRKEPIDGQVVLAIETAEINYWLKKQHNRG
ncbi:MAG: hypothetical protein GY750_02655 [Lentisphaerae bacterium]|nr:hypothetical protein [Lentisphaerota bacterium]